VWRIAAALAFGATAVLAVGLARGGSLNASLASGPGSSGALGSASVRVGHDERQAVATPRCGTSRLRITARAGDRAGQYIVEFTNVSGAACSLRGYPSVYAYGPGQRELGAMAALDASAAVRPVVLGRGKSAASPVAAVAPSLPARRCRPVTAAGLRVVPPGDRAGRLVRQSLTACSAGGTDAPVFLRVRPVQPG
jgi:hypothetical protein